MVNMFSIQVVNLDYYLSGSGLPVIRVYGSNQRAESSLVHIHGVFPYLYFRPHSVTSTFFEDASPEQMSYYQTAIRQNIEDGVNKRRADAHTSYRKKTIVHKVEFVQRTSMYGFQPEPQCFARVWLRDPGDLVKVVAVLEEGEVLKQAMQPFESHVPFLLQFFLDYEVYGMGWLHFGGDSVMHRKTCPPMPSKEQEPPFPSEDIDVEKVDEKITEKTIDRRRNGQEDCRSSSLLSATLGLLEQEQEQEVEKGVIFTPPNSREEEELSQYYPTGDTLCDESDSGRDKDDESNGIDGEKDSNLLDGFAFEDIYTQSVLAMTSRLRTAPSTRGVNQLNIAEVKWTPEVKTRSKAGVSSFKSVSSCRVECDVGADHILNPAIAARGDDPQATVPQYALPSGVASASAPASECSSQTSSAPPPPLSVSSVSSPSPSNIKSNNVKTNVDISCGDADSSRSQQQCLSCVRSLKELWDEERIRRGERGDPSQLGEGAAPPSTQTMHRPLRAAEEEYARRLKILERKGEEWFGGDDESSLSGCPEICSPKIRATAAAAVSFALRNSQTSDGLEIQSYPSSTSPDERGVVGGHVDNLLSQFTTAEAPVANKLLLDDADADADADDDDDEAQLKKHVMLRQNLDRLSGMLPDEGEEEEGNEMAWQTQSAQDIVDAIHAVQSDNTDIVQFNRVVIDEALSGGERSEMEPVQETKLATVPTSFVPVPVNKNPPKRRGIIRGTRRPPLDGRLGRLLHSTSPGGGSRSGSLETGGGDADISQMGVATLDEKNIISHIDREEHFGLVDVVDRKRKSEKKKQHRKRRRVGFISEPLGQDFSSRHCSPLSLMLTPDGGDNGNSFFTSPLSSLNSPLWISPIPSSSTALAGSLSCPQDTSGALIRLACHGVLVVKPSFHPPSGINISTANAEECWDKDKEEPFSYLHTVPFFSDMADKDVITGAGRGGSVGPRGEGWHPASIKHRDDLPSFGAPGGDNESEIVHGTLESCIAATIESSSLPAFRVHCTTPRCLVPTFSPPSNDQVLADFQPPQGSFLTPPAAHSGFPSPKMSNKIVKVLGKNGSAYHSPRKSQLATPTQTQPKKTVSMKVNKPKPKLLKQESISTAAGLLKAGDSVTPSSQSEFTAGEKKTPQAYSRLKSFSMELFASCTGANLPNPKLNPVHCIFYVLSEVTSSADSAEEKVEYGVLCLLPPPLSAHTPTSWGQVPPDSTPPDSTPAPPPSTYSRGRVLVRGANIPSSSKIRMFSSEIDLFLGIISVVQTADPDFLVGYEVQNSSWGYLIDRALNLVNTAASPPEQHPIDLLRLLSRVPGEKSSAKNEHDIYGQEHDSGLWINGRTVLNLWRRMRAELKLSSYTMSSVSSHLLLKSFPEFSPQQMSRWFQKGSTMGMVVNYLYRRASTSLVFIDKLDLIRRTAESARLYGIDFYSVLSRGSQYRVEAVMLRVAHRQGFVAMSPSKKAVACQAPMEVIPLVMEPRSNFYVDPVVVLDFQSLYPSMIIAYNLCFSTIMGKLKQGTGQCISETTGRLGAMAYPEEMSAHSVYTSNIGGHDGSTSQNSDNNHSVNRPYIAPNGSVFCPKSVRHGILPLMLKEILETRLMVKRSMKLYKTAEDDILHRVLDARQLALKMIANVTYGYTAAGYSGRMPMAELADAIVQCGRSTLEWVITEVERHPHWRGKVVYGDTDSVFVHLKGRTKAEAFDIGAQIAHEITRKSPVDVLLKMEKVYLPSVLVSKKRYVGNAFEDSSPRSTEVPHFDAKGIEVVRRDQCGATVKIQEKALRILFQTKDLSLVKAYLYKQWAKIHEGGDSLPLQDFIFRKEVKLGHYAKDAQGQPRSLPPGALVATEAMKTDPRAEPPYKWRVPYVVVSGEASARLKDLVVSPAEVLRRGSVLRVNHLYYITKHINPALDRVLNFAGISISHWYKCMKHPSPKIRQPLNRDVFLFLNGRNNPHPSSAAPSGVRRRKAGSQTAITDFMGSLSCVVCGQEDTLSTPRRQDCLPAVAVCDKCSSDPAAVLSTLHARLDIVDSHAKQLQEQCLSCTGGVYPTHSALSLFDSQELHTSGNCSERDVSRREAGRGLVSADSCVALDCPVQFSRCQYLSRCEELRVTLAHLTLRGSGNSSSSNRNSSVAPQHVDLSW